MKRYTTYLALLLIIISSFSVSCAQEDTTVTNITVDQLKKEMVSDTSLIVLDVRRPDELTGPLGKIDKVVNIPVEELGKRIAELDKYKSHKIAAICRSGRRSLKATKILMQNGFNVENVEGGMEAYHKSLGGQ